MTKFRVRLMALAVLAAIGSTAQAGLQPMSVTVTPEADGYRYAYGVVLTSDSKINPGDFFTIFDFKGYVPGSAMAPAGFSFSTADTGGNPIQIGAVDDATLPNLSWTYNGSTPIDGSAMIGEFGAVSTFAAGSKQVDFAALTHTSYNDPYQNVTVALGPKTIADPVEVVDPVVDPAPSVPEPATYLMAAFGIALALVARRRVRVA